MDQQGFERGFETCRRAYESLLVVCLHHRLATIAGSWRSRSCHSGFSPTWAGFFPSVDGGQIKMHMRAQTGTRIEETTRLADQIGRPFIRSFPFGTGRNCRQHRRQRQRINMAYNNSGTIGRPTPIF